MANLILTRQTGQNQYYEEALANEVLSLQMMLIPAGSFLMGSPPDEIDRYDDEGPQHEVNIELFFMSKYPITQAQWQIVAAMPQIKFSLALNPSNFQGDLHPVEQVSWHEAVEFCDRLTVHTGRQYRLPTEAEWEYACRANTTTPFHFGKTITTDLVNYRGTDEEQYGWSGSDGNGPKGEHRETTTPVNHFEHANVFGLCDMHGNVWEWCQDHYHNNYEGAPTDGSAWITEDENANRVLRGGSWFNSPRNCRSACRSYYNAPDDRYSDVGFRVVVSLL
jgi:formylglycine-generating enzyme required for sulfatase activity